MEYTMNQFEKITDPKPLLGIVLVIIICLTIIISIAMIKDCTIEKQRLPESPKGELHESH